MSFAGGEGFSLSWKRIYNNENILKTHVKWQLNEVQLQVFKATRRRSEASESKTSFSRIMDLTGQTMLVDCFYNFIEVFPPLFIHNLSHLKWLWWVNKGKNEKKWGLSGGQEAPSSHLNFWFRSRPLPCYKDSKTLAMKSHFLKQVCLSVTKSPLSSLFGESQIHQVELSHEVNCTGRK